MSVKRPNILYILPDQVSASILPLYGRYKGISTPNIDRLAAQGVTLNNAVSTAPVCTPYRSMMMTGRHPLTTGHVINFVRTRNDEIGLGDAFARAGYRTGYVGKWHLHTGSFPEIDGRDYVPEGRDRLGWQYWRGYNFHTDYFDGWVNRDDWRTERWKGYETEGLATYTREFLDTTPADQPFFLVVSPHQCHWTPYKFVPDAYYDRLPDKIELTDNCVPEMADKSRKMMREYLAMLLAVDDMLGELLDQLDATGRAEDTLVIFTSDHGTQFGAQGCDPWAKRVPYEESVRVPWVMRWPGRLAPGTRNDTLLGPADIMPSLCTLCGVPIPRTVEGVDLSGPLFRGDPAPGQDAVLLMSFSNEYDFIADGDEWRGVRTPTHTYARWLNGKCVLFDDTADPSQSRNLADDPDHADLRAKLESTMQVLMQRRSDPFAHCSTYADWIDTNRRIVANTHGPLGNPEDQPDWSLIQ